MHVKHWFHRLESFASQNDQIAQSLQHAKFLHPWLEHPELHEECKKIYGDSWSFDPTEHITENVRAAVETVNPELARQLHELYSRPQDGKSHSYLQVTREIHRVFASTLDYSEGSLDAQLIERSFDGFTHDGFTLRRLMRACTVLEQANRGRTINCDEKLSSIKYTFVKDGIRTYFAAYRAQLDIFKQMELYELPEKYHCDRILSHLRTVNKEFHEACSKIEDRIEDKRITKTINNLEKIFQATEKDHKIGPSHQGTPLMPTLNSSVNLAKPTGQRNPINVQRPIDKTSNKPPAFTGKDKRGSFPKGSCSIHKFSTTHLEKDCQVKLKRDNFIHPVTGARGLTPDKICPLCPLGWHPAELHDDPRYNPPRTRGNSAASKMQQYQRHLSVAKAQMATVQQWQPIPPLPAYMFNSYSSPSMPPNMQRSQQQQKQPPTTMEPPPPRQPQQPQLAQMARTAPQTTQQIANPTPYESIQNQLSSGRY